MDFTIDPLTEQAAIDCAHSGIISRLSPDRIRVELQKSLAHNIPKTWRLLDKFGLIDMLFGPYGQMFTLIPTVTPHHSDLWYTLLEVITKQAADRTLESSSSSALSLHSSLSSTETMIELYKHNTSKSASVDMHTSTPSTQSMPSTPRVIVCIIFDYAKQKK